MATARGSHQLNPVTVLIVDDLGCTLNSTSLPSLSNQPLICIRH